MGDKKFKICRIKYYKKECESEPILTQNCETLKRYADEYYETFSIKTKFLFLQTECEFIWRFEDCGENDVFFPLDRLPKNLEKKLLEQAKAFYSNKA
jgi:hypothetical protein